MSAISLKSITGITSITTPSGVDNVFTVHTNDTTERFRVDQTGNLNIAGIVTVTKDLDVDGHTNLDNVSIAGVTTVANTLYFNDNVYARFGTDGDASVWHDNSHLRFNNGTGNFNIQSDDFQITDSSNTTLRFRVDADGATYIRHNGLDRLITSNAGVSFPRDIDVDGHTNLDNVSIAGVSTVTGNINVVTAGTDVGLTVTQNGTGNILNLYDGSNLRFYVNQYGNPTVTSGNPVITSTNSSSSVTTTLFSNSAGQGVLQTNSGHSLILGTGGVEKLRITGNGHVNIGGDYAQTTYKLKVTGTSYFNGALTASGKLLVGTTTAGSTSGDEITVEGSGIMGISLRSDSTTGESNVLFADGTSGSDRYTGGIQYQHQHDRFRINVNGGQLAVQINKDKSVNTYAGLSVSGIVTATSFSGDGSNLTGITGTTINNNADNRIITGSGTANTLQGEANLTYNGTLAQLTTTTSTNNTELIRLQNSHTDGKMTVMGFNTDGLGYSQTRIYGGNDNSGAASQAGDSGAGKFKVTITNPSGTHQEVIYAENDANTASKFLRLSTDGSERLRITSDGKLLLGSTSSAGSGYKLESYSSGSYNIMAKSTNGNGGYHNFTGQASNGTITSYISHNGRGYFEDGVQFDSSGESLDSYEEGTWTPTLVSPPSGANINSATGYYTKIGNMCTIWLQSVNLTGNNSSNNTIQVGGIPFSCASGFVATGIPRGYGVYRNSTHTWVTMVDSGNNIMWGQLDENVSWTMLKYSGLQNTSNVTIQMTLTYKTT